MWKLLLLFFLFFFNVLSYAQDLQSRIQQFRIDFANLSNVSERLSPDTLIAKGKRVLKSYQTIVSMDSAIAEPYLLFLPFRAIAEGYDQKNEYKDAIPYYEQAVEIAINYTEKLEAMGLNMDGYLSLFNSLRDDYVECEMPNKTLALSQKLLEMDRQYATGQIAYQQSRISEILLNGGKTEEALQYDSLSILAIEQYGNTEHGFYVTTPVRNALVSLVLANKFNEALAFMNANRDRVNKLIVGKDSLELSQLATINACMYRTYMGVGLLEKAVNTAFLVSNYIKATKDTASVDYAVWLHNAACAYLAIYQTSQNEQSLNNAMVLLGKSDKIWKNVKNRNNNRDYAIYLKTRGDFFAQTKQMRKAEKCYRKAISLHTKQKASEQDILSDFNRLASFYSTTGKDKDAINLYTSLMARYEKLNDSLHLVRTHLSLTIEYLKANNLKEAEKYATMAYKMSSIYYPNTIVCATAEGNLSDVYARMGLADRADELRTQSILAKQRLGITVSPDELLDVYDKYLTRFSDVLRYYTDTLKWYTQLVMPYCEKIISDKAYKESTQATALKLLAKVEMFTKEYQSAQKHFVDCLDIERKLYGKKDNRYLTTMNNLSYCYLLEGNNDKSKEVAKQVVKYDPSHENYENLLGVGLLTKDTMLTETALKEVYDRSVDFLTSRFLFMSSLQREEFIDGDNIGIVI